MDGPGTMSWEEFVENAESFVRVSDEISDGWELRGEKSIPGEAYLYRQIKTFVPCDYLEEFPEIDAKINVKKAMGSDEFMEREVEGDPYEATCQTEQPLVTEHHVLWHMSYGVPVIYFNAWFSDFPGVNQISVTKAQRAIPRDTLGYDELSQAIHPIVGTTFLYLHPCKSQELLSSMCESTNKLASWLSAVSPAALNLKLSLKYFELTRRKNSLGTDPSIN
ncbi:ubiquitin-like-conjugating enzyme ATG10 [Venturia canescens]|uniref:ubiquitin-like-conjugating enzyme ATG10 n=1 Tax=Venturia canescens TaxID=32260 RepID=UPI001C9C0C9A|nr:ubiquitin-like-conjugating enzyme ATG10 [Venturia canescens]XP_043283295.1 ubiquitin-like-conjugating enzyme ATG10 [Venturia canescens]XP_043283296.1 ubiquitin-like-conjugating enzyme ATG10 [Venturia canescens]XP_043283297.1 ubiquitin-like-conjugating enzyme ATG10 [Venturia canescens]XP_043283298.1 ubiquitin-like-conjugating enzyme ATG10 [Venturia canescens]XP_043283300.1 ubiquitin-like-conjugating enzyme ATG10 [Venturia canescens]